MKEEVLRLDRVMFQEQGVLELNHFNLTIFTGEIMGLIPVNGKGLPALLRLLRQNLPLHYGFVHYREKLVNHWLQRNVTDNRVAVIENRSGLADDLTVAENVFVLRQGFKKRIIQRKLLNRLLDPFFQEIGVRIPASAYARDLTPFERFVVEIVKAVVAGCRLIILNDAGTIVSDAESHKLRDILRHYASEGISFLYVSRHYEEIRRFCDKAAFMVNGQIAKVLSTSDTTPDSIHSFSVDSYEQMVLSQRRKRNPSVPGSPVLELRALCAGAIAGLTLTIGRGECVVVQDLENQIFDDLLGVLSGGQALTSGELLLEGRRQRLKNNRDVAIIQQLAAKTMLFPELSYMDNLCMTMDHRLPGIWLRSKARKSVRGEYAPWLGDAVFDQPVDKLTPLQQYDLIYARILLQHPQVVFCLQPFMQADVEQRMHIWKLIEKLLEKEIAVVILAVNLADTLSLADRLVQIQNGQVLSIYQREAFGELPVNTPWRHLWKDSAQRWGELERSFTQITNGEIS